jgi:hypothetical protein
MPTTWVSVNRDFFKMVSFEAGGLRILHLFSGYFSGYTSGPIRVSEHQIADDTRVAIHKCFWRALAVRDGGLSTSPSDI